MQIIITEIWDALIVIFLADFYFLFMYLFFEVRCYWFIHLVSYLILFLLIPVV